MQKNKYYTDYTEKISKDLHEEFTNYNECEFACDCAFKLGHGMNPTSTYTYALKSFVANGGNSLCYQGKQIYNESLPKEKSIQLLQILLAIRTLLRTCQW